MEKMNKENLVVILRDEKINLKTNALIGRILEYYEN